MILITSYERISESYENMRLLRTLRGMEWEVPEGAAKHQFLLIPIDLVKPDPKKKRRAQCNIRPARMPCFTHAYCEHISHRSHRTAAYNPAYPFPFYFNCLDQRELGGGDVQSINVRRQAGVSLLGAVGSS